MAHDPAVMSQEYSADQLLRSVAAHGLAQRSTLPWPTEPLEEITWGNLIVLTGAQRLQGFLAWACDDGFPVTDEQADQVAEEHASMLATNLQLERLLLDVTATLIEVAVYAYVLKGPALAHLLYPDPAVRLFGDIDLLIRSDQYDRGCAALSEAGYERQYRGPRPGWDERFAKGTVFQSKQGSEIDVHRTLSLGPYGLRIVLADVFADPVTFRLADRELLALSPEVRFLHACYHAALGDITPRLVPLRDIAQMLLGPPLDMDRVDELIGRWRAEAVVARAIGLAVERLGLPDLPLADRVGSFRGKLYDRIAMAAYVGPEDNNPKQQLLTVMGVNGIGPKVAYLRGLLFPKSDYLEGRHRGQWARWRYAVRNLAPHRRR